MKKTKTISFSTMLVALLTILTVLLGALFVAKPVNAPTETVRADEPSAPGVYGINSMYNSEDEYLIFVNEEGWYDTNQNSYSIDGEDAECWVRLWELGSNSNKKWELIIEEGIGTLTIYDKSIMENEIEESSEDTTWWNVNRYYGFPSAYVKVIRFGNNSGNFTRLNEYCFKGLSCNTLDIYYGYDSEHWDDMRVTKSFFRSDVAVTIHCVDEDENYVCKTSAAHSNAWSNWETDESIQSTPANTDPEPEETGDTPADPGSQQETPSTGIEVNIGVAIASLALVGTLFVTVRRKEER